MIMNRTELALELLNPNEKGVSRWVCKDECVGEYSSLMPQNGNMWYRNRGIGGTYKWEKKYENGKTYWRLNGFLTNQESRPIRNDIRQELMSENPVCAHTGFGYTPSDKLIIDHRNGRYNESEVLSLETQQKKHFQVLSNRTNLAKRTACGFCQKTNIRFDAKTLGFSKSVCSGSLKYEGSCVGCYWYGPKEFRKSLN